MTQRAINPRILQELGFFLTGGAKEPEAVVRKVLALSRTHGLYAGGYEKPGKHFAIPELAGRNGRSPKYPFYRMEVGESVDIGFRDKSSAVEAARAYGKRHGMKFTHKPEGEGVRIWRVS